MRLDDDKLEALQRWGGALRAADDEERAAAGRAILMLVAEVERSRLELFHARELRSREEPAADTAAADADELPSTLHGRLQRAPSPEAWIESLRRHE